MLEAFLLIVAGITVYLKIRTRLIEQMYTDAGYDDETIPE